MFKKKLSIMSSEDFSTDRESVLFTTFSVLNESYRVYFRRGTLIWSLENGTSDNKHVPIRDIISVDYVHDRSCNCKAVSYAGADNEAFQGPPISPPKHDKLVINYAVATSINIWRPVSVVFRHEDNKQVDAFVRTIQTELDALKRPRRFLVFVNPNSGKRRGERIYRKSVEPILHLANVKIKLIITQHAAHSKEFLMEQDLSQYDAILTVGGDGTVSEVINALVRRRLTDLKLGNSDIMQLPSLSLPLAVIPGGSTDCIAYTMNGSLDRRTAALYGVLGETAGLDVCSVSSPNGLLKCFVSLLGYGFLGDVLETSERYRWMGPKRYDFSGVLKLLANRWYHCKITMQLDASLPAMGPVCYRDCQTCDTDKLSEKKIRYQEDTLTSIRASLDNGSDTNSDASRIVTVTGKYFWVTCANISCACPRSPVGVAPLTHLGDGTMDVLLIKPRSPIDVLKLLLRSASKDPAENIYDLPFVETYKVTELSFEALNRDQSPMALDPDTAQGENSSVWNCDGEIIRESNVRVRNHRQHVKVLTRRKAPPTKQERFTCLRCVDQNPDYVT